MTTALATPVWLTTDEVAEIVGVSPWVARNACANDRAHSHAHGPRHARQHFVLEAPFRLYRQGADIPAQRRVCAGCRGLIPPPPVVLGRRRSRRTPAP